MRNYSFRRVTPDDLALLHQWLDMPHVKMWWGNARKQIALIKQDMENTKIDMHMVELVNHPFAYIHHHDAFAFGMPEFADLPPATRVIGTFVGHPEYQMSGWSPRSVRFKIVKIQSRLWTRKIKSLCIVIGWV